MDCRGQESNHSPPDLEKVSLRPGGKTGKRSRSKVPLTCLNFVGGMNTKPDYHVHGHRDDCG